MCFFNTWAAPGLDRPAAGEVADPPLLQEARGGVFRQARPDSCLLFEVIVPRFSVTGAPFVETLC